MFLLEEQLQGVDVSAWLIPIHRWMIRNVPWCRWRVGWRFCWRRQAPWSDRTSPRCPPLQPPALSGLHLACNRQDEWRPWSDKDQSQVSSVHHPSLPPCQDNTWPVIDRMNWDLDLIRTSPRCPPLQPPALSGQHSACNRQDEWRPWSDKDQSQVSTTPASRPARTTLGLYKTGGIDTADGDILLDLTGLVL